MAVGLAWLAGHAGEGEPTAKSSKKKRRDPWRDIREYLSTQAPEALSDLLLEVAQRDDRLYQSLLLKAERTGGGGNVAKAFRRAIDDATRIHGCLRLHRVGQPHVSAVTGVECADRPRAAPAIISPKAAAPPRWSLAALFTTR